MSEVSKAHQPPILSKINDINSSTRGDRSAGQFYPGGAEEFIQDTAHCILATRAPKLILNELAALSSGNSTVYATELGDLVLVPHIVHDVETTTNSAGKCTSFTNLAVSGGWIPPISKLSGVAVATTIELTPKVS